MEASFSQSYLVKRLQKVQTLMIIHVENPPSEFNDKTFEKSAKRNHFREKVCRAGAAGAAPPPPAALQDRVPRAPGRHRHVLCQPARQGDRREAGQEE